MKKIKNWLKETNNQFLVFCLILVSLPLLLIEDTLTTLPLFVTLSVYAVALLVVFGLYFSSKPKKKN